MSTKKKKRNVVSSSEDENSEPETETPTQTTDNQPTTQEPPSDSSDSDSDDDDNENDDDIDDSDDSSDSDSDDDDASKSVKSVNDQSAGNDSDDSSSEMSESDDEKFPDGLDKDCIGDDEDRQRLEKMTEVDRETELYRRMEERERLINKRKLERNLKRKRKEARQNQKQADDDSEDSDLELQIKKKKKPNREEELPSEESSDEDESEETESESDGDSDYGQTTEQRKKKAAKKQMKALEKARKAKRKKEAKLAKERKKSGKLRVQDVYGSSDGSSSDEDNKKNIFSSDDDGMISSGDDDGEDEDDRPVETYEELNIAKLSRFRCEQWCHNPWFEKAVTGMYVRVGLGQDKLRGRETYRCCEVVGICKTAKPYAFNNIRTNIALNLKLGENKRGYRLNYISNQLFTESEFNFWKQHNMKHDIPLPTYKKLKLKQKELNEYKKKEATPKEFEKMIETKKKFQVRPTNFAREKSALNKQKQQAIIDQDQSQIMRIERRLKEIEEEAGSINRERMSEIINADVINKKIRTHLKTSAAQAVGDANKEYRMAVEVNPFMRRKTQPLMGNTRKCLDALDVKYKTDIDKSYETVEHLRDVDEKKKMEEKKEIQKKKDFNLNAGEKSMASAHAFDLDIDMSMLPDGVGSKMPRAVKPSTGVKKAGKVSLMEYKKKKGLI